MLELALMEVILISLPSFLKNVGYATSKGSSKYLDDEDYRLAHRYVLSNCELLTKYERYRLFRICA